jgi:LmbE family N-acetylglucosaminyl deacetylase
MIIAPHPDDEALACGGLISLARDNDKQVSVVFMTDGGASHQGCFCDIPPEKLGRIRREMAIRANAILGVDESNLTWLNLRDGVIPDTGHFDFERACHLMVDSLCRINPQVVLVPHIKDMWPDHIATTHITQAALSIYGKPVLIYYYLVWFFLKARLRSLLKMHPLKVMNLDINAVINKKRLAIESYMSDINPICGIPYSGQMPKGFVELFQDPYELFITGMETSTFHHA